jgi:hypothetical protein
MIPDCNLKKNIVCKCKGYAVRLLADTNLGRSYKSENNVLIYILHTRLDFKVPVSMISETNGLQ